MGSGDYRYTLIKPLVVAGTIGTFSGIFDCIPPSVVSGDLGKRLPRFKEMIEKVEEFQLKELLMIAKLCDLNRKQLFTLIENELANREIKT